MDGGGRALRRPRGQAHRSKHAAHTNIVRSHLHRVVLLPRGHLGRGGGALLAQHLRAQLGEQQQCHAALRAVRRQCARTRILHTALDAPSRQRRSARRRARPPGARAPRRRGRRRRCAAWRARQRKTRGTRRTRQRPPPSAGWPKRRARRSRPAAAALRQAAQGSASWPSVAACARRQSEGGRDQRREQAAAAHAVEPPAHAHRAAAGAGGGQPCECSKPGELCGRDPEPQIGCRRGHARGGAVVQPLGLHARQARLRASARCERHRARTPKKRTVVFAFAAARNAPVWRSRARLPPQTETARPRRRAAAR